MPLLKQTFRLWTMIGLTLMLPACNKLTGEAPKIHSEKAGQASGKSSPSTRSTAGTSSVTTGSATLSKLTAAAGSTTRSLITSSPAVLEKEAEQSLDDSPSPYLRDAVQSPVHWLPWSDASFALARQRNLPVIIDIGASWSHPSLEMANATYGDKRVAEAVDKGFTAIKVDADLRPDVWSRYRVAYELINRKRATLPLTIFALPDGRPIDCMAFVAPESHDKSAGMIELLDQVSKLMSDNRKTAEQQADRFSEALQKIFDAPVKETSPLDKSLLAKYADFLSKRTSGDDTEEMVKAGRCARFLLHYYSDSEDKSALAAAGELLLDRFRSGQRDNVLGGYFTRSTADGSVEYGKTLPVQAEFISANSLAYAADHKSLHKESVEGVLKFCRDTLEAPDGGFYSSQAPDIGPGDNGSYFTWSPKEIESIAGDGKQTKVFEKYLNADSADGGKANLHVTDRLSVSAEALGIDYNDALKALDVTRARLHQERMTQAKFPYINKAIFAGWNGDMICAYLDAYQYTGDVAARDFALKSVNRVVSAMVDERRGVGHVMYKGKVSGYGYLEDNVKIAAALLRCFEVSGHHEYFDSAQSLMTFVEARFLNKTTGLYRDYVGPDKSGLMKVASMPVEDGLTLSPNAIAARIWYHFYQATSEDSYLSISRRLTEAAIARRGLASGAMSTWGEVASMIVYGAPKALIIGKLDDGKTTELQQAALPVFRMGKFVEVLSPKEAEKTDYVPAKDGSPIVYVCTQQNCAPPVREKDKVVDLLKSFGRSNN